MDPIIGGAIIGAGANLLGGLFGSNNQRQIGQQNAQVYANAQPYAAEAYNTVKNLQPYSAPRPPTFGTRTAAAPPLNQSGAFSNVQPYNPATALAKAGPPPDTTGMWANVQPFDPQSLFANIIPPSLEDMLQKGLISESAFENIKIDPKLRDLQMRALNKLQEIADNDGMTIQERVRLRESMDTIARQQRMQRYAIQQSFEARGLSGSGVEIAMTLAANQGEAEGLSVAGAETAAAGAERAFQATMQAGQMAGQIAQADFEREARIASARDAIATFNASQTIQALQANFQNQMAIGGARAQAGQQAFANWMDVVKAKENATNQSYEYRFQQAAAYANAGQQWFANSMNVLQAQYSANQQAYENYFTWARATDDYAVQQYDANFRAVKSEYDAYLQRISMQANAANQYASYIAGAPGVPPGSPIGSSNILGSIAGGVLMGPIGSAVGAIGNVASKVGGFVKGLFSDERMKTDIIYLRAMYASLR